MKKTILKSALVTLMVAAPAVAFGAIGLIGDCYDCHTMHNSEQNSPVAMVGSSVSATPIENLLKLDCIACHAQDPTGGSKIWTMSGGSTVPQVMHGDSSDLAGGNWRYMIAGGNRKGHNVKDLKVQYGAHEESYPGIGTNAPLYSPPGLTGLGAHSSNREAFTSPGSTTPFDMFTCAGARGCHGTRSQLLSGVTTTNVDGNFFGDDKRRVGISAISGSHHNIVDGAKDATNYPRTDDFQQVHDGAKVAEGYRFIVGLKGYGNETARWENVDSTNHNEYYGVENGLPNTGSSSCHRCHIEGHMGGLNSRAAFNSTLVVPNNSMSGFCASCHGGFHSSGAETGADPDTTDNGVSGAFLRHPSDYTIPASGEYLGMATYDITAPVARATLATSASASVSPGSDLVMCLSCHKAHGSTEDYILNFNYASMTAGLYGSIGAATAKGGCLACHTTKGVLPPLR